MRNIASRSLRITLFVMGLFFVAPMANAQSAKLPSADDVKALQSKYRAERDKIVKEGVAKRYLPAIMDKADELAKKSDVALASGRLAQAVEAIRQARWQLPYQPVGIPEHTARVIGNLRLRHSREVKALAYSPDGTKIASASSDHTVKVWDLGNGHEILSYTGHTDKVTCLAWSADGTLIASAGNEKNIKVWNASTGKDVQTIAAAGNLVSSLAFSKDGKHLFTGQFQIPAVNPPNGLFVYETQTGKLVREAKDFPNRIGTISVSPDGTVVATGDDNGNTRLWQYPNFVDNANQPAYWTQQDPGGSTTYHLTFSPDSKTFARFGPFHIKLYATPLPGAPFKVATPQLVINAYGQRTGVFSKDGKTLFSGGFDKDGKTQEKGGFDGNIYLWDPESGQIRSTFKNAHNLPINQLVFNPDGNQLASCAGDFIIRLWDFDVVLQSRDFVGHEGPVWTAFFSPDATRIISSSGDRTVKVWNRDIGTVAFTINDHTSPVTVAMFSPDGKLIASAGGDKVVRIFDADGKALRTCEGHQGTITYLDFSPDSKRIVTGSADRTIKIWDADDAKLIASINDNPSIVAGVAFSPNGKQVAVANVDQTICLYDATNGKLQHRWIAHGSSVNCVAYSPDGTMLASGGADLTVAIWPLNSPGANPVRLLGHTGPISSLAFRKDNQHLVSCGADQLVKLWKIEGAAGKEMQTFRGHKDWVTSVAFSKDGYHVVSASVDRRMKIWEITSKEIPLLAEHSSAVECIAVSPNGKYIATGSVDRTVKLWDRDTGVEIATLSGHKGAVMSIVFSADSKRLYSSDIAKTIRIWEVSPAREIPRSAQQLKVFDGNLRGYSPYIAIDPTGKLLYVWQPINGAKTSTIVEVFDIEAGTFVYEFMEDSRKINSLSFCANGKLAATGAKDGSVRLWEMGKADAKPAAGGDWNLFGKTAVADIGLTADGNMLIATSEVGDITIAKIQGREIVKSFKGHDSRIMACMISPDGKRFATLDGSNLIKVWDMAGTEIRRFDAGKHQDMFIVQIAFTNDGKQLVTANANTTVYVLDLP